MQSSIIHLAAVSRSCGSIQLRSGIAVGHARSSIIVRMNGQYTCSLGDIVSSHATGGRGEVVPWPSHPVKRLHALGAPVDVGGEVEVEVEVEAASALAWMQQHVL
jgi:hypothetical protein